MSEIGHAKGSFLEALEGAEVDPAPDMAQNSLLSVSSTGFVRAEQGRLKPIDRRAVKVQK